MTRSGGQPGALLRLLRWVPAPRWPEVFIWPEPPASFAPQVFEQGVGAVRSYHGEPPRCPTKSLNTLVNHLAKPVRVRAWRARACWSTATTA